MSINLEDQIFKNTLVNAFSLFWNTILGFIIMPIMVRNLHQDGYGLWTLIMSFSMTGYLSIVDFGMASSVTKFVAEYDAKNEINKINQVISITFFIYFGLGIVATIGVLIFKNIYFFKIFKIPSELIKPANMILYTMAVRASIDFPTETILATLRGFQRYDLWRFLIIAQNTIRGIFIIVIFYFGMKFDALCIILVGETIFKLVASTIVVKNIFPQWRMVIKIPLKIIQNIIVFSGKMFAIRLNALVYNGMDKIIIGNILGVEFLTNYAIASRFHSLTLQIGSLISLVLMPTASMLFALKDFSRLQRIFIKSTKYSIAITVPVILALMILAKPIIYYWIGQDYTDVYKIVQLFLSYLLFRVIAFVSHNMLIGIDKAGSLLGVQIITTIINLIISIALVYKFGVMGVILGTIIGTSSAVLFYVNLALKNFKLSWYYFFYNTVLKVFPISLILAFFLILFSKLSPPQSLLEVGIYIVGFLLIFFSMFVTFSLDKVERIFIWGKIHSIIAFIKQRI